MESNNMKRTLFLAGPMRDVPRSHSLRWRQHVTKTLSNKFHILHALRGREEKETFPDPKGAVVRDKQDILRSDLLIVDDSFENASMIGTAMEVLFAYSHNKPVIVFGSAHKPNYWLDYHATLRVENVEKACQIAIDLFAE